jgi:signal transduction histidine kinase
MTARLAGALTPEQVIEVVLSEGLEATGAAAALVALLDDEGETLRIVAERGYAPGQTLGWEEFPLTGELPVSVVVRERQPAFCATRAERDERFPPMAALDQPSHALVALPLVAARRALGGIALSFEDERHFEQEEQRFLQTLANQCAQALERAQLYREAERRAEAAAALAFVADGVALVDPEGVVRLWNDAAARITGLAASVVEGFPLEDSLPAWSDYAGRIPVAPAGEELPRPLTLPLEVGGGEHWLSIAGVAFADGTVYAFRDVSEEQGLERMKSDFIATVSHELRTPLAAVYGAAATLRKRPTLDLEERERFLDMIAEQSERLSRIVAEILTASRLDAGEVPLTLEGVDAAEVAREVVEVALRGAPAGFEIAVDAEPGLPPVRADRDRLRQVLGNLVENAVKYSGESVRAEVRVEGRLGAVRFVVRDFGIGIPPEEQGRIFGKFYRVDPSMSRGVSGTGLGLYIVRELVRRMGGTIRVESEAGQGAAFVVELRAAA